MTAGMVTINAGSTLLVNGSLGGSPTLNVGGNVQFGGNSSIAPVTRTVAAFNVAHGASVMLQTSQSWSNPAVLLRSRITHQLWI
jgi:hypothetical protein